MSVHSVQTNVMCVLVVAHGMFDCVHARYEVAVAADLARQASRATLATNTGAAPPEAPPEATTHDEEDEIERAIAMSLAAENEPASGSGVGAEANDRATAAVPSAPAVRAAEVLSPEELRAARLARFG